MTQETIQGIYNIYPRKRGKTRGFRKLAKLSESDLPKLEQALSNFLMAMGKEKRSMDKVMYFSTWVNQWEDWIMVEPDTPVNQTEYWKPKHDSTRKLPETEIKRRVDLIRERIKGFAKETDVQTQIHTSGSSTHF